MEPITVAGAFATIVGLLGAYKAEGRAASDDEFKDFQAWLASNNHNEVIELLERNTAATTGIRTLLNQDRQELFEKLDAIDQMLAHVASRVDGFGEIAEALRPGAEISEQALSVLSQIFENNSGVVLLHDSMAGKSIIPMDGDGGSIDIPEPRFIEDDLATMCEYGLLRPDYNSKGDPLYRITRTAARFVLATR